MVAAETICGPRVGVAAVAAATGLRMVEVHFVALMVRVAVAAVAEHAGLVGLARAADPHNVVLFEGIPLGGSVGRFRGGGGVETRDVRREA